MSCCCLTLPSAPSTWVPSSVLFPLLFRRFDADGDGVVQRAEVQAMDKVIERTLTEGGSMAAVFKVADANDDGLLQRNTEVVPLLLDVLQMYLRAGEQVRGPCVAQPCLWPRCADSRCNVTLCPLQLIDVGVELFEHEAPTLLTLAGLPAGHSVSLDDLLAMIPDGVYEAAESNYVMTVGRIAAGLGLSHCAFAERFCVGHDYAGVPADAVAPGHRHGHAAHRGGPGRLVGVWA